MLLNIVGKMLETFYVSAVHVFSKALCEKEKLLIKSNFSFSHSVFLPLGELSAIFKNFEWSSANSSSLEESKFWERVKGCFLDSVHQDQDVQNVESDLGCTLSDVDFPPLKSTL